MNTYKCGYSLSTEKDTVTFEENIFEKELKELDEVGYIFPHYFNEKKQITKYKACVIKKHNNDSKEIDRIYKLYGIKPNTIYFANGVYHFIFFFEKPIGPIDYNRINQCLSEIYQGESLLYHFYKNELVKELYDYQGINNLLFTANTFYSFSNNDIINSLNTKEQDYVLEINKLPFNEVLELLYDKQLDLLALELTKIDIVLNIHTDYGKVFNYVLKYFKSLNKTKEFFNNNYEYDFTLSETEIVKGTHQGTVIKEGGDIFFDGKGYATTNAKGDVKSITDFYIKIYYKTVGIDGITNYIISLVNPIKETETPKIILTNKTSPVAFADFCQSYGDYHFYGAGGDVKQIHNLVSQVPGITEIQKILGYGEHFDLGLIFFKNGIWEVKSKMFIEKPEEEQFYEGLDGKGYAIVDAQGNSLDNILGEHIPVLNTEIIEKEELIKIFDTLYTNSIGKHLLLYFLGYAGYLTYGNKNEPFPMLFLKGTKGSGKTVANSIMQTMTGSIGGASAIDGTSAFVLSILGAYLIKLPIFLSEYRESIMDRMKKVNLLRSMYDKTGQSKGKADQTLIKYDLYGVAMLEGEEMIKDGATRNRTIQIHFKNHKHKFKGDFITTLRESKKKLEGTLFSYFLNSDGEKYREYIIEGKYVFDNIKDSRTLDNICNLYAGAMCYMPEEKDFIIENLKDMGKNQIDDLETNSTDMQIIKIITRMLRVEQFASSDFIFPQKDRVIITWQAIEDYVGKNRIETSLSIEEYKNSLENMGYDIDYVNVGDRVVEGIICDYKNMRNEFLVNQTIYQGYNNWKKIK